jgi:hypothetical protein
MGLYYEYLGPKILTGFDSYKYSSKDTSPLSQYVMHPFWNQVCVAAELLCEQKYYPPYKISEMCFDPSEMKLTKYRHLV